MQWKYKDDSAKQLETFADTKDCVLWILCRISANVCLEMFQTQHYCRYWASIFYGIFLFNFLKNSLFLYFVQNLYFCISSVCETTIVKICTKYSIIVFIIVLLTSLFFVWFTKWKGILRFRVNSHIIIVFVF